MLNAFLGTQADSEWFDHTLICVLQGPRTEGCWSWARDPGTNGLMCKDATTTRPGQAKKITHWAGFPSVFPPPPQSESPFSTPTPRFSLGNRMMSSDCCGRVSFDGSGSGSFTRCTRVSEGKVLAVVGAECRQSRELFQAISAPKWQRNVIMKTFSLSTWWVWNFSQKKKKIQRIYTYVLWKKKSQENGQEKGWEAGMAGVGGELEIWNVRTGRGRRPGPWLALQISYGKGISKRRRTQMIACRITHTSGACVLKLNFNIHRADTKRYG